MLNLRPVLRALEAIDARCALIGGHALAARGYPRMTVDVDLLTTSTRALEGTTWTALAGEGAVIDRRRGDADDPLAGVVHVLLADETDIDVIVGRWQWEADVVARAEPLEVAPGLVIPVPLTSDLILLKLAAGGPLDLRDAAALLMLGPRDAIVHEVELRLGDVRPDVREVWRRLQADG